MTMPLLFSPLMAAQRRFREARKQADVPLTLASF